MKIKSIFAVLAASILVTGCTSLRPDWNYYTSVEPTLESMAQTDAKRQIHKKTLYIPSDFNEIGQLRTISEYDFSTETAPCTAISAYRERPIYQEEFFTMKTQRGSESMDFLFECRSYSSFGNRDEFRLFLIGSYEDCKRRTWEYKNSSIPFYQEVGKQCASGFETATNKMVKEKWRNFVMKKP